MYLNPSYTVSSQSRPFRNNTAQWLAGAAVIKDHRRGGAYTTDIYCLLVPEARSLKSGKATLPYTPGKDQLQASLLGL